MRFKYAPATECLFLLMISTPVLAQSADATFNDIETKFIPFNQIQTATKLASIAWPDLKSDSKAVDQAEVEVLVKELVEYNDLPSRNYVGSKRDKIRAIGEIASQFAVERSDDFVCSAKFISLNNDGTTQLVVATRQNVRFCGNIEVIDKVKEGFTVNGVITWDVQDIGSILYQKNGSTVLAVPERWSPYEGANACEAGWTKVYAWNDRELIDVSASSQNVYRQELLKLNRILVNPGIDKTARPCLQMEADKISRFLTPGSTQGIDRARTWMISNDPYLRMDAVTIFSDIMNDEARAQLSHLASDRDADVAAFAQAELSKKR